jgi:hypothetical protein
VLEELGGMSCARTGWDEQERLIPMHIENANAMTSLSVHILDHSNGMII